MSFVEKVRAHAGRKTPVQSTIRKRWSDIEEAVEAGQSRAAIRRTLAAEGCDVGKNESSFNRAYLAVRAERAEQTADHMTAVRSNAMSDKRFTSDY